MKTHLKQIAARTLILQALMSSLLMGKAGAVVVERIAAVVGDQVILLSEVRRRAAPFYAQMAQNTDPAQLRAQTEKLYREVLDRLIDESLIQQAARRMLISVPVSEENKAIENVQKQTGLSDADFWKAVREQGFTETEYRTDVRRQLLRYKVLNQRMRGRINIGEQDIRNRFEDEVRKAQLAEKYLVSHIAFLFENGDSATDIEKTHKKADEVHKKLQLQRTLTHFEKLGGTDLGWVKQGELSNRLDEALRTTPTGHITPPIQTNDGFHIFFVRERQKSVDAGPSFEEAREGVYRRMVDEAMAKQEKVLLMELRKEAVIQKRI